ncbi:unnamed protein product [Medioppia subpectinata]|uniref:Uncharacterized protein n=1 Tax=Medioppia subpectinata TaxID=1979941 RepID=A0A7R9KP60_9ACAR|nr:unnamed protein product [Medioppia subpectinata]CAG2107223.1 unnamed protein product [Medioppia subpectinata]
MTATDDPKDRSVADAKVEDMEAGAEEEDKFECECRLGPNESACYTQFARQTMIDHRIDYQSCDYWDDDCYNLLNERIIAIMSILINSSAELQTSGGHKKQKKRLKTSVKFQWRGRPVCKALFLFVHAYGHQNARNPNAPSDHWVLTAEHSVKSIYRHFLDNYSERRISYETFRNVWRTHCPGITFEAKNDKSVIIEFIKSYAKRWSTGHTDPSDPKALILSADHNVKIVYAAFKDRHNNDISYDVFNHTWKTCCPYIRFENSSHYSKRKCSHCGVDGHTNRKIGDHFLCPLRESESGLSGLMKKASNVPTPVAPQPTSMAAPTPQVPDLMGQMMATTGGFAISSAVGHTIGHVLTGGSGGRRGGQEVQPAADSPHQ